MGVAKGEALEGAPSYPWFRHGGRVLLALMGGFAMVGLVREAGSDTVATLARNAAGWVMVAFAIEGLRILVELAGSIALIQSQPSHAARQPIPFSWLLRSHLVIYAISMALPAGRAASEAYKVVAFKRFLGAGSATAVGTTSQALNLIANASVSVPAAIVAVVVIGFGPLAAALVIHAALSLTGGLMVLAVSRSDHLLRGLARFRPLRSTLESYREVLAHAPLFPPKAALILCAGRALQVAQFGVLAFGVGLTLSHLDLNSMVAPVVVALLTHGVQAVGATAGDLVPGQLGVTEGAFRLAASAFGTSAAVSLSVALLAHAVQLTWIVIGSVVPILWRSNTKHTV